LVSPGFPVVPTTKAETINADLLIKGQKNARHVAHAPAPSGANTHPPTLAPASFAKASRKNDFPVR
jgi:hypothetical protein